MEVVNFEVPTLLNCVSNLLFAAILFKCL